MPVITLPIGAPFQEAAVNTAHIFCAAPDAENPDRSNLFIHAVGQPALLVELPLETLAERLGDDFVRLDVAGAEGVANYLSRSHWVSIVPHPETPDVTQVDYRYAFVLVKGTMDAVIARLTP